MQPTCACEPAGAGGAATASLRSSCRFSCLQFTGILLRVHMRTHTHTHTHICLLPSDPDLEYEHLARGVKVRVRVCMTVCVCVCARARTRAHTHDVDAWCGEPLPHASSITPHQAPGPLHYHCLLTPHHPPLHPVHSGFPQAALQQDPHAPGVAARCSYSTLPSDSFDTPLPPHTHAHTPTHTRPHLCSPTRLRRRCSVTPTPWMRHGCPASRGPRSGPCWGGTGGGGDRGVQEEHADAPSDKARIPAAWSVRRFEHRIGLDGVGGVRHGA